MALFHHATIAPTKAELLADWIPTRPWAPTTSASPEVIGAFRFNDPEGSVGLEGHLVDVGGTTVFAPVTYRAEPLHGAEWALVRQIEHSALGTRWVYDGLGDPVYVRMLAAAALTGQGEALGMLTYDGVWHIAPASARMQGGGWGSERVSVDGFTTDDPSANSVRFTNDRFEMMVDRQPVERPRPSLGLSVSCDRHPGGVVIASVTPR